jgi:hypothetical protein
MAPHAGGASDNLGGFDLGPPSGAPVPAWMARRSEAVRSSRAGIRFQSSSVGDTSASPP